MVGLVQPMVLRVRDKCNDYEIDDIYSSGEYFEESSS